MEVEAGLLSVVKPETAPDRSGYYKDAPQV